MFFPSLLLVFPLLKYATSFIISLEAPLPLALDLPSPISPSFSEDTDETPLPLVIWHGLGDRFDADGLKDVATLADQVNPGSYVHIIRLADDGSSDRTATYFGNLTEQVDQVCQQLAADNILSTAPAIDALGFSQGGQFMRAYVERCNKPPVRSLVTFGAQHNGISEFQKCASPTDFVCQGSNALLRSGTWSDFAQSRLVPAQYFRDPTDLDQYLEFSNFLADINNERTKKNATYKKNLSSLKKFIMYRFEDDQVVIPKDSSWFADFNATSDKVTYLKDRPIYKEDWIGLRALDEKGGLVFGNLTGQHMQLSDKVLRQTFKTYFGPLNASAEASSWRPPLTGPQFEL